jgi:colanic acid/amylovoran biosynthesis protein
MKKAFTILIPNGTSPKNIGDHAILLALLDIVQKKYPTADIILHSTDPQLHNDPRIKTVRQTLYGWAVFENRNFFVRVWRLSRLFALYYVLRLKIITTSNSFKRSSAFHKLMRDYQSADLIVFTGGGYLRSGRGLTQTLNVLMQIFMFRFAKLWNKPIIVAPISFGPFAYRWQERVAMRALRDLAIVSTRGEASYLILEVFGLKNLIRSSDLALLLEKTSKNQAARTGKVILGFTVRRWLRPAPQKKFEDAFTVAVVQFARESRCSVLPIVQVDAPEYGDDDAHITQHIAQELSRQGINVLPMRKVENVHDAQQVYAGIDVLLGMRMHSNILAAVEGTPFVALAYEHKTAEIAEMIGLGEYCIPCERVTAPALLTLLRAVYNMKDSLRNRMRNNLAVLRRREEERWASLFGMITTV